MRWCANLRTRFGTEQDLEQILNLIAQKTLFIVQLPRSDFFIQISLRPWSWLSTKCAIRVIHVDGLVVCFSRFLADTSLWLAFAFAGQVGDFLDGLLAVLANPILCSLVTHVDHFLNLLCLLLCGCDFLVMVGLFMGRWTWEQDIIYIWNLLLKIKLVTEFIIITEK